jgi:DNA-binding CsgD family transcriptional regulator
MTQPKLTKQQAEVLRWVQQGYTNKQIAKRLGLSDSTIKLHVGAVLKKYGCANRSQLALFSLAGKSIQLPEQLPEDVEPKPFGWVLRKGKQVVAVSFQTTQPAPDWEAMYTRKGR